MAFLCNDITKATFPPSGQQRDFDGCQKRKYSMNLIQFDCFWDHNSPLHHKPLTIPPIRSDIDAREANFYFLLLSSRPRKHFRFDFHVSSPPTKQKSRESWKKCTLRVEYRYRSHICCLSNCETVEKFDSELEILSRRALSTAKKNFRQTLADRTKVECTGCRLRILLWLPNSRQIGKEVWDGLSRRPVCLDAQVDY